MVVAGVDLVDGDLPNLRGLSPLHRPCMLAVRAGGHLTRMDQSFLWAAPCDRAQVTPRFAATHEVPRPVPVNSRDQPTTFVQDAPLPVSFEQGDRLLRTWGREG